MLLGGSWTRAAAEEEIHDLLKKGRDDITEKDMATCLDIECRFFRAQSNLAGFSCAAGSSRSRLWAESGC